MNWIEEYLEEMNPFQLLCTFLCVAMVIFLIITLISVAKWVALVFVALPLYGAYLLALPAVDFVRKLKIERRENE